MARSSSVSLRNGRDCQFECRGCADGLYCRQKHSRKWRRIGIEYDRDRLEAGHNFAQQLNPLCPHAGFFGPEAGYVAAGTGQTLHEALGHWQRTRWGWCWSPVARRPTTAPNWPRGCRVASRPAPWRAPALPSPAGQRYSISTSRPGDHLKSSTFRCNAAACFCPSGSLATRAISTPIRRMRSGCCARAASGHVAAMPPSAAISCRRSIVTGT